MFTLYLLYSSSWVMFRAENIQRLPPAYRATEDPCKGNENLGRVTVVTVGWTAAVID